MKNKQIPDATSCIRITVARSCARESRRTFPALSLYSNANRGIHNSKESKETAQVVDTIRS